MIRSTAVRSPRSGMSDELTRTAAAQKRRATTKKATALSGVAFFANEVRPLLADRLAEHRFSLLRRCLCTLSSSFSTAGCGLGP